MQIKEWTKIWHNTQLDVGLLQAFYVDHTFPRHSHDYYVICLIERGLQSFTHEGTKYYTPPGGLILITIFRSDYNFYARSKQYFQRFYGGTLWVQKYAKLSGWTNLWIFLRDVTEWLDFYNTLKRLSHP